jgi:hypothetical protein
MIQLRVKIGNRVILSQTNQKKLPGTPTSGHLPKDQNTVGSSFIPQKQRKPMGLGYPLCAFAIIHLLPLRVGLKTNK